MSEAVTGGIGGFIGGLVGGLLAGRTVTIQGPGGNLIARVLIEPWDFLGVSVMKLRKVDGPRQLQVSGNVKNVLLKGDPANTSRIWLGGVSVGVDNGYPIDGNSILAMQIKNFNDVYVLAESDMPQTLYVIMVGEKT
ncbi:MAG: hypothetical protein QXH20_03225 [Candidatus Bathyarchaeia archaeon]